MKDVCYQRGRIKQKRLDEIDPHRVGANPSIRKEISKFFSSPENADFILLVPVSGPKTKTWFSHLIAHSCTMIIWRELGANGEMVNVIRQFDPNIESGASIMVNTVKIASDLAKNSQDIEILCGPNDGRIDDGHCFAINWQFIAKALDGRIRLKTRRPSWTYNMVSQKYFPY